MHVGENIGEVSFHSYISGKFRILFWVSHEIDDSQSSLATCSSNLEPFSNEDRAPFERGSYVNYKDNISDDRIGKLFFLNDFYESAINEFKLEHIEETVNKKELYDYLRGLSNEIKVKSDKVIQEEIKESDIFRFKSMLKFLMKEEYLSVKKINLSLYNICSGFVHGSLYSDHRLINLSKDNKEKIVKELVVISSMNYIHAMCFTHSVFYTGAKYYKQIKVEKDKYFDDIINLFASLED